MIKQRMFLILNNSNAERAERLEIERAQTHKNEVAFLPPSLTLQRCRLVVLVLFSHGQRNEIIFFNMSAERMVTTTV